MMRNPTMVTWPGQESGNVCCIACLVKEVPKKPCFPQLHLCVPERFSVSEGCLRQA